MHHPDLGQRRILARKSARPPAASRVHMAQAEALLMMGEQEQASALVERHV